MEEIKKISHEKFHAMLERIVDNGHPLTEDYHLDTGIQSRQSAYRRTGRGGNAASGYAQTMHAVLLRYGSFCF